MSSPQPFRNSVELGTLALKPDIDRFVGGVIYNSQCQIRLFA